MTGFLGNGGLFTHDIGVTMPHEFEYFNLREEKVWNT